MNIALWVVAGLLAAVFLASGAVKLARPGANPGAFGTGAVRAIGTLEILAAVGLILPAAFNILPVLVPAAAVGLVLLMVGAMATHLRRHESRPLVVNVTLLALAAFVALGR